MFIKFLFFFLILVKATKAYLIKGTFQNRYDSYSWRPTTYRVNIHPDHLPDFKDKIEDNYKYQSRSKKILYINFDKFSKERFNYIYDFEVFLELDSDSKPNVITHVPKQGSNVYFTQKSIYCGWGQCDLGLHVFATQGDPRSNESLYEYGLMVLIKSSEEKMSFFKVPYYDDQFLVHACPSSNFVIPYGGIEYINKAYKKSILDRYPVLLAPTKKDGEFYVCGILKQPTLPDLKIGFKLIRSFQKLMEVAHNKYPSPQKSCEEPKNMYETMYVYYHDNYLINGKTVLVRINKNKEINMYGKKIYVISMVSLKTNDVYQWKEVPSLEVPKCIEENNIYSGEVWPVINGDNKFFNKTSTQIYYKIVETSNYNKNMVAECKTIVGNGANVDEQEYFSKAIKNIVIKKNFENEKDVEISNLIFSENHFNSFGIYTCKTVEKAKAINGDMIKIYPVHFFPTSNSKFTLNEEVIKKDSNIYPSCKKLDYAELETLQILTEQNKPMEYELREGEKKREIIVNYQNYYDTYDSEYCMEVECNYVIPNFNIKFTTYQHVDIRD